MPWPSPRHQLASAPWVAAGLLALCGPLGGCGSASGSRSQTHANARSKQARAGKGPTPSQAAAFARAVNLTATDVPGFTAFRRREGESEREKRLQLRLLHCAGPVGSSGGLTQQQSPSFRLKEDILDRGVSSEVTVARTSALAASELAAIRRQRVRACFSRYLELLLASQRHGGAPLRPVSIASGTPPAPGATGSFGWRITTTFSVGQLKLSLYVDILGFVVGPARVTLVSSGALRPFPAAIQQRLYALLLARASARAL
jgi:hypothetical protein